MVNKEEEKRNKAEYSLTRIHELADQGSVHYGNRRVQRHVEIYNYTPERVNTCLTMLNESHFHESVRYGETKFWLDVYFITCTSSNGNIDDLYIKLKLDRDCVWIVLDSFHPEGAI
jgi:motility quorum-sensing regulator / GCU-specific mRNA interferase toxin